MMLWDMAERQPVPVAWAPWTPETIEPKPPLHSTLHMSCLKIVNTWFTLKVLRRKFGLLNVSSEITTSL